MLGTSSFPCHLERSVRFSGLCVSMATEQVTSPLPLWFLISDFPTFKLKMGKTVGGMKIPSEFLGLVQCDVFTAERIFWPSPDLWPRWGEDHGTFEDCDFSLLIFQYRSYDCLSLSVWFWSTNSYSLAATENSFLQWHMTSTHDSMWNQRKVLNAKV